MKTALTIFAYAVLVGFLYILVSEVPRWDLGGVVGVMMLLALWDLFFHDRTRFKRAGRERDARAAARAADDTQA